MYILDKTNREVVKEVSHANGWDLNFISIDSLWII